MMNGSFKVDEFRVDPDRGHVTGPAGEVHLEPRVMEVLVLLARNAGAVVYKQMFSSEVWRGAAVGDDPLVHCISRLRKVLGASAIQTIPKRGYMLAVPVEWSGTAPGTAAERRMFITLEAVLAHCSDHIYVYDRDGRYLYASEVGAQALGRTSRELIGKTWQELDMPAEIMVPFHRQVAAVFSDGRSVRETVSYPTIYGVRRYEYILDPILDSNGGTDAVLGIVRQICADAEPGSGDPG